MAILQDGGYIYILENTMTGRLKFGITMKTVEKSYASSSRFNDGDLKLRSLYFFSGISYSQLKEYEDEIKRDEIVSSKTVPGRKEWLDDFLYEYLDYFAFSMWSDWQHERQDVSYFDLLDWNPSYERHRQITKALLDKKADRKNNRLDQGPSKIFEERKQGKGQTVDIGNQWDNSHVDSVLEGKISKNRQSLGRDQTEVVSMTDICQRLNLENNQPNFKRINKWLIAKGYLPRRSNGKKLWDLYFIDATKNSP